MTLTEHETGQMVALMDAKWITGKRTAGLSARGAPIGKDQRYTTRHSRLRSTRARSPRGDQGESHLTHCRAYDIMPDRQAAYVAELDGRFDVTVTGAESAEAAVRGADIVVTGGPISEKRQPTLAPEWVSPGALLITIDYGPTSLTPVSPRWTLC